MGEKVEVKNEGEKKAAAAAAEGGEKIVGPITVVLKLDLHCQGCAKKVRRSVAHLQGVETVKAECDAKRLTVTGNVDPLWLREKLEIKTKKKVDLISPHPNNAAAGADHKIPQPVHTNNPKKAVVSTVTMKTKLHCDECADKIKRIIIKNFDGIASLTTDLQKSLIIVIGTMDVNDLVTYLREKLKRGLEIVTPKKADGATTTTTTTTTVVEKKANEVAAVDSKQKASGGEQENKGKKSDIVGAKQKEGGGDKKEAESKLMVAGGGETKVEMSKMEYHSSYNPQTHYAMPMMMHNQNYGHQDYSMHHHHSHTNTGYYGPPMPPPTYLDMNTNANDNMFSDENPNGCSLM